MGFFGLFRPEYALREMEGAKIVCRRTREGYSPLTRGDFGQGLLDYLVAQVRSGHLNSQDFIGFQYPSLENDRHAGTFVDSFHNVGYHYNSIRSGGLRLTVDRKGRVNAFSKYLPGIQIRPGD